MRRSRNRKSSSWISRGGGKRASEDEVARLPAMVEERVGRNLKVLDS